MKRFALPVSLAVISAAVFFALGGRWPWERLHVAPPIVVSEAYTEVSDTLRSGETLSDLLTRQRVTGLSLYSVAQALSLDPKRLRAGLVFNFRKPYDDSVPTRVEVRPDAGRRLFLRRDGTAWNAEAHEITWRPEVQRIEGPIDNSLYQALDEDVSDDVLNAGERVRLAWDLADVFAWEVDFTRDIRPGDRFEILFERQVSEEGEVRFGRVLASRLSVGGRPLAAYRFTDAKAGEGFYDDAGLSLRRAFLRAPVQFRRISSSFARSRFQPILGMWRKHEGTDYAAAPGTPVLAAGDGIVLRAGPSGGYGNLIEIRHPKGITTRYGHLRGFAKGIHSGARVTQGQTIGYVGSTGLATGPHLHYEFRVNGAARDARRVDLGNGEPVAKSNRDAFVAERDRLAALLAAPPVVAISGN